MKDINLIFGRMGNRMFQMAALYSFAKKFNNGDVFFTDIKWFEDNQDEIRKLYGDGIINQPQIDKVAIHVRRGDYLREPHSSFHANLCDTNYYEEAVRLFPNEQFLVFCADRKGEEYDIADKKWCVEYFTKLGINFEMANTDSGIEDMNLMARCKHQIIANSSFSWWAAFLNPNPNKTVISAQEDKWYCDGQVKIKVPSEWRQLLINKK